MANQDQNDTSSNLSRISGEFRNREIARNDYDKNDEFGSGHKNALSDGDEKGKGETDTIGGKTDIKQRKLAATKNKYNLNNEYNDSTA